MRLSERELDILGCMQLQANVSVSKIVKETGYRDHTVRYCQRRLREVGLISPYPFINLYPLGYTQFSILFSLASDHKGPRAEILQALVDSPRTSWISEVGGDYQYRMTVCAKDIYELSEFFDQLSRQFGNVFFEKSVTVWVSWRIFRRKYLSDKPVSVAALCSTELARPVSIDESDHRILSGLSNLEYGSRRELAELLGLPLSTLEHRIKRLRDKEVLLGFCYSIDVSKLGMHVYRLLIFVNALNLDLKERFSQFFEGHRNVVSFVHCIGSWDYELRVEVQDPQEIVQLKQQLYELFGNDISTVKVLPMFSDIKISNYPFYDITAELPRAGRPHGDTVLATSNRVANQSGPTNQNRAGVVKVANG